MSFIAKVIGKKTTKVLDKAFDKCSEAYNQFDTRAEAAKAFDKCSEVYSDVSNRVEKIRKDSQRKDAMKFVEDSLPEQDIIIQRLKKPLSLK